MATINADSWEVTDNLTAVKKLDAYAFVSRRTGIPVPIRDFFGIADVRPSYKREITMHCQGARYKGVIFKESIARPRTRLTWDHAFQECIKSAFPKHYQGFLHRAGPYGPPPALLIMNRTHLTDHYIVSLSIERPTTQTHTAKNMELPLKHLACEVCRFVSEDVYGVIGKGVIAAYTGNDGGSVGEGNISVCANCTRVLEASGLSLEEVKATVLAQRYRLKIQQEIE